MGLDILSILKHTPRDQIRGMTPQKWFECAEGSLDCFLRECPEGCEEAVDESNLILRRTVARAVIRTKAETDDQFCGGRFSHLRRPEVVDRIEGRKRSDKRRD